MVQKVTLHQPGAEAMALIARQNCLDRLQCMLVLTPLAGCTWWTAQLLHAPARGLLGQMTGDTQTRVLTETERAGEVCPARFQRSKVRRSTH